MKFILCILMCVGIVLYQNRHYAQEKKDLIAYYEDKIQWTIQDTGDDLMRVCDEKIDEILGQF